MAAEVVGVHEMGLGGHGLAMDVPERLDLGSLVIGERLAGLQTSAESCGERVCRVRAPGLAREDGLLVLGGTSSSARIRLRRFGIELTVMAKSTTHVGPYMPP